MKIFRIITISLLVFMFFNACDKDDEIDEKKPIIDLTIQDAFPVNCDTLYFGETFELKVLFSDNVELGSKKAYSIDIHHNFDHHSHSTEVTECNLDPKKDPLNPFVLIENYDIPEGLREYTTDLSISIPSANEDGQYDEGDYHFMIKVTDKEGWSAQKGLSIKMLHR